jgi:predicted nucleotidyltransferase
MAKSEVISIAKKYADKIVSEVHPDKILLFGSYAKGNDREYSDIDIAIVVSEIQGDILDILAKLYKIRRSIDIRIEPHVFEYNNDESGMLAEVLSTGEVIYQS